jgi:hypothetical protein
MNSSGEWKEAIETGEDGAIFVAKQPATPPRRSKEEEGGGALACCDSLALAIKPKPKAEEEEQQPDTESDDDAEGSVVSLELLTVVDDPDYFDDEKTRLQQLCGKRLIGCWICGLLLLILAIALPLTLRKGDETRDMGDVSDGAGDGIDFVSDNNDNTNAYDILQPLVANPEALLDPSTPEGQAFLDVESNGEQNPFDIQQQYALQMLYYSTAGEAWVFNNGWQSYSQQQQRQRMRRQSLTDASLCSWAGVAICRHLGEGRYAVAGLDLGKQSEKLVIGFLCD